jgi:hypothetical protein
MSGPFVYNGSPRYISAAVVIWDLSEAEAMALRRDLDSSGVLVGADLDQAPLTHLQLAVNRILKQREQL